MSVPKPDSAAPPVFGKYEIEDGVPKNNGDASWRAMIQVPRPTRPGMPPGGVMCIRGKSRASRKDAEEDGLVLEEAAASGDVKKLREVQRNLNKLTQ